MKTLLTWLMVAALLGSNSILAQSTVESVPNQRLVNGSHVSNPDNILSEGTVVQIDSLLLSLEGATSVQVAVVALQSIGDEDIFDFAQRLFTVWGIGNKEKDNGLLLLLVKGNHTIRFQTGSGVEGVLPDALCRRIQGNYMVPEFKNENYDGGMLAGLQQVDKILRNPAYAEELKEPENVLSDWAAFLVFLAVFVGPIVLVMSILKISNGKFSDSRTPAATLYPEMLQTKRGWLAEQIIIPVVIIAMCGVSALENPVGVCCISLYLYYGAVQFYRLWRMNNVIKRFLAAQEYYEIVEFLRKEQLYWLGMAIVFPIPFLPYFFYHLARKRLFRNHPRNCKLCQGSMHKLSEKTEDAYLSKEQQMEETLHSIDYDVWLCDKCQATEEWLYPNKRSKYTACPKCNTWAYYLVGRSTIVSATYSSGGRGEESHACKFCGHTTKTAYTIARLTRSSSSGSSSSDSSSSSGGSSWGGGSSGGGGASSSW